MSTLMVILAHPDDELRCAGTIAGHRARGDRVVLMWLTRGEAVDFFGHLPTDEVARLRTQHGLGAAEILDCEARFLDFPDAGVEASPAAARRVAFEIARFKPDAVLTWGEAWNRGARHPDHQATGKIARDAITLARLQRLVAPLSAHREPAPVYSFREHHSFLPAVVVDVSSRIQVILDLLRFYRDRIGITVDEERLLTMLQDNGRPWGLQAAELFDAWEGPARSGTTLY